MPEGRAVSCEHHRKVSVPCRAIRASASPAALPRLSARRGRGCAEFIMNEDNTGGLYRRAGFEPTSTDTVVDQGFGLFAQGRAATQVARRLDRTDERRGVPPAGLRLSAIENVNVVRFAPISDQPGTLELMEYPGFTARCTHRRDSLPAGASAQALPAEGPGAAGQGCLPTGPWKTCWALRMSRWTF